MLFLPKTVAQSKSCGQGHCRGEGTNHRGSTSLDVFSVHYRVIFSTPSNKFVHSHFVREEQIPCTQLR